MLVSLRSQGRSPFAPAFAMTGSVVGLAGALGRVFHFSAADDLIGVATLILFVAGASAWISFFTSGLSVGSAETPGTQGPVATA